MNYQDLRALFIKRFHIPRERAIERAMRRFTLGEKAVFYFFTGLFLLTGIILVWQVNNSFLIDVPISGGSFTEGVIGNPRFINPVLAISEADKNLVSLIYSGLIRPSPNGRYINDLASSIEVSADGLVYTAHLRNEALFQDNTPVTADDIVFTIQKILDPNVKSPLYGNFAGVSVKKVDDNTITFNLHKPYAAFINNLSIGILPKHIWLSVTNDEFAFSQWNVIPVGSGPYKVETVTRDSGGIPNYYELTPFDKSLDGAPYIARYIFKFFPSEADLLDAYDSGSVEGLAGISPAQATSLKADGAQIFSSTLPRVFGVFFNQNSNTALLDKAVRQALDLTAPKQEIVDKVLDGYGTILSGPLPPGLFDSIGTTPTPDSKQVRFERALALLNKNGWLLNASTGVLEKKSKKDILKLSFTLSTSDNPELKAVAEMLKASWQELGAEVGLTVYEQGDLNQSVIRPRKYDALLFGEVVGRDADVYSFWHSSEKKDPGLNIALYTNSQVDKLLSDARAEIDPSKRETLYKSFDQNVRDDVPAVFLYSPSFLFVAPTKIKGIELNKLGIAQDRFLGIKSWYIETNAVWNLFVKSSN